MPRSDRTTLGLAVGLAALGLTGAPAHACTARAGSSAALAREIAAAPDGATVCLGPGRYATLRLRAVTHRPAVTVTRAPGLARRDVRMAGAQLLAVRGLALHGLTLTDRVSVIRSGSDITVADNDIVGRADGGRATAGVYLYGWIRGDAGIVADVRITGNDIHGMVPAAGVPAGPGDGYGVVMAGHHRAITVAGNTIRRIAIDAIQSSGGDDLTVDGNRFLGPGHDALGVRGVHADLWQVFGDADGLRFTNNIVVGTGTDESLLFQSGRLRHVVVTGNRFDRDSTGYSAQIWPVDGLTLRDNTFHGSRWGVALRGAGPGTLAAGRDYRVTGNTISTAEGPGLSLGAGVAGWGLIDTGA